MAKTKIGKVKILLKGEYNANTQYIRLDGVTYNGSFYICKQDCQGINVDNQEYWQLAAEKGDKPINGVDYNTEEEKAEFKKEIISEGKTQLDEYNVTKKAELDAKEVELEGALTNKKDELIIDIDDTLNGFEDNVEQKVADFNTNASEKTASFNQNAQTQTSAFDSNAETQTEKFNTNATSKTNGFDTNATEKTTSFDTNATEKTTAFDTNATSKTNEYNSNATQLTTQTDDLFDALTTNEASGTELYIEDAKACRIINTEIDGMYKQETTTGANLLDTSDMLFNNGTLEQNGLTAKINTDGSIVINGTATANTYFKKSIKNILEDGNYYFYNFNNVTQSNSTYYMLIQGNKSTGYESTDYYNARGYQTDNFIKDIITYDRAFDCMFVFINGFVANNLILYPEISKTEQNVFEPYTGGNPSPNPYYSQEIEQVESVKLNINNKNLFNKNIGIVYDKHYSLENGELEDYKSDWYQENYINAKPNTTYSISVDGNIKGWLRALEYNANKNFLVGHNSYNFTTDSECRYLRLSAGKSNLEKLQLEIGEIITEYSEYDLFLSNIDLKGNKLCAVSDTIKDKLLIDRNGNVALQKNVGKNIFDGTKKWKKSTYTENTIFYLTNTQKAKFPDVGICNYFPVRGVWGIDLLGLQLYDLTNIRVGLTRKSEIQTEDAFNEWLTTHNLEVYYALATPELIDLGQLTELPKTFNGINNIWAETNLGNTEIEIEYVQDVKKLLEQTQAIILNNASEEVTEE